MDFDGRWINWTIHSHHLKSHKANIYVSDNVSFGCCCCGEREKKRKWKEVAFNRYLNINWQGAHDSSHHGGAYAGIYLGDPDIGELTISEMSPEDIRAELKRYFFRSLLTFVDLIFCFSISFLYITSVDQVFLSIFVFSFASILSSFNLFVSTLLFFPLNLALGDFFVCAFFSLFLLVFFSLVHLPGWILICWLVLQSLLLHKRLYTQLEVLKNKTLRQDNPHISKRRGGRKPAHRRFSLQVIYWFCVCA